MFTKGRNVGLTKFKLCKRGVISSPTRPEHEMTDDKGLGAIPIHLDMEQADILAAHGRLKSALNAIQYPESGRWEDRDTAIWVLEAVAEYVSATFDIEEGNHIQKSGHTEVLQDVILHFRQAKRGAVDRRLAVGAKGEAGSAHDDALVQFKSEALKNVEIISSRLKIQGVTAYKAAARNEVVDLYEKIGLTFYKSKANPAEKVTVKILESWEKRIDKGQRSRA